LHNNNNKAKGLHGQFPRSLDEGLIDKEQSYRWLKFGDIKGEIESVIMAAQDQAIVQRDQRWTKNTQNYTCTN
jgi:hypothetical protein